MQTLLTEDGKVLKVIHRDKSETAIKTVATVYHDKDTLEIHTIERNKYIVFVSTSVGCAMSCTFCHLTIKNAKFRQLSHTDVVNNLKEAITHKHSQDPSISESYIKLSWMGMGDAFLDASKVLSVSVEILKWVLSNGFAKGIDGVDLSTVYPEGSYTWEGPLNTLNNSLSTMPLNPATTGNRTPFRLFYSIHTMDQELREEIMPHTLPLDEALTGLTASTVEFNTIFHMLFLDGVNDTLEDIHKLDSLREVVGGREVRVLRYNECDESPYIESRNFPIIIQELNKVFVNLKIQSSPGSEVKAACGQFIVDM